jgi:hypothetical protein
VKVLETETIRAQIVLQLGNPVLHICPAVVILMPHSFRVKAI